MVSTDGPYGLRRRRRARRGRLIGVARVVSISVGPQVKVAGLQLDAAAVATQRGRHDGG